MMVLKFFNITLHFVLCFFISCEETSKFTFRCVDSNCSVPIRFMKGARLYNPDHERKIAVKEKDIIPIYGESEETKLYLTKKPNSEEFFVVPYDFLNIIKTEKEEKPKTNFTIDLPTEFANSKRVSQLLKIKPKNQPKSDLKLRVFLNTVLNDSKSFFKTENYAPPEIGKNTMPSSIPETNKMKSANDSEFREVVTERPPTINQGTSAEAAEPLVVATEPGQTYFEPTTAPQTMETEKNVSPPQQFRPVNEAPMKNSEGKPALETKTQSKTPVVANKTNFTIDLPTEFANSKRVSQLLKIKPKNQPKSDLKLRVFLNTVLNDSKSFFKTENYAPPEIGKNTMPSSIPETNKMKSANDSEFREVVTERPPTINQGTSVEGAEPSVVATEPGRTYFEPTTAPQTMKTEKNVSPPQQFRPVNEAPMKNSEGKPALVTKTQSKTPVVANASEANSTVQAPIKDSKNEMKPAPVTETQSKTPMVANVSEANLSPLVPINDFMATTGLVTSPVSPSVPQEYLPTPELIDISSETLVRDNPTQLPTVVDGTTYFTEYLQPDSSESEYNVSPSKSMTPLVGPTFGQELHDNSAPSLAEEVDTSTKIGISFFSHCGGPLRRKSQAEIESSLIETSCESAIKSRTEPAVDEKELIHAIQQPLVDEKPFYNVVIEYLATISFSMPSFNEWISKNEVTNEFCSAEQDCDAVVLHPMKDVDIGIDAQVIRIPFWGEITPSERESMMTYLAMFSLTVLLATAILSMFNNGQWRKKEKKLAALVNRLESKLLVSTREISSLEEQINNVRTRPVENTLSTEKKEAIKEVFNRQLKQYQDKNTELEDKVTYLEKELESVSNYALEMHKLFENSLTTQSTSRAAIDEVDELRTLAEKQENEIEDLRREMESIIIENQILKETNTNVKSSLKKLEMESNLQMKKNLELSEKQKEFTFKLEKEVDNSLTMENEYKSQIYQLRSKLEEVEMKLKRSEFQVDEMNRVIAEKQDGGCLNETAADVQLKIQLSTLEAMNTEIAAQLKEEKGARHMVEDHMGTIIKELNNLKKSFESCEKERSEAVTKLQVLADYFDNEKTKMHKELEAREKLLAENENKDQLLSRTMQSLKDEINNYKLQNEALKKEINEQEASYKMQLANAEQKGREDWFAFRKIERKYKECQQEAASLRNRILILESSVGQKGNDKANTAVNGELTTPAPPLMYPPLISADMLPYPADFISTPPPPSPPLPSLSGEFMEPPMPPLYSTDERLPPLGGRRIPSPPDSIAGDDYDFTPPPPIPGYLPNRSRNEMSSSYTRTTPPSGRHRSQYKGRRHRSSVDSPSSGMSMESLDKSTR